MVRSILRPALALVVASAQITWTSAQLELVYVQGDAPGDVFGQALSGVGDVDGDGYPDFLVGARLNNQAGQFAGAAYLFSGENGNLLLALYGDSALEEFGYSVAGPGDVNGDAVPDFLVGAALDNLNGEFSGSVFLFSGADSSILSIFTGEPSDRLGRAIAAIGDVTGDGVGDFAVGASPIGSGPGYVNVYSGSTGANVYSWSGNFVGDDFGTAIAPAGDVNADGTRDVIVGANDDESGGVNAGKIYVFSGSDGSEILTVVGSAGSSMGLSVAGPGDLNGDGFDDVLTTVGGDVHAYSGASGSLLYITHKPDVFTNLKTVSALGDVNKDSIPDFVVGALGIFKCCDSVWIVSGSDGTKLSEVYPDFFYPQLNDTSFGGRLAALGDINADGYPDFIAGAYGTNGGNPGWAKVFSGILSPWKNAFQALSGANGPPRLQSTDPLFANTTVVFTIDKALGSTMGWFVIGLSNLSAPFKGGVLLPNPDFVLPISTNPDGTATITGVWPAGLPVGFTAYYQAWFIDAAGVLGFSATNAISSTLTGLDC